MDNLPQLLVAELRKRGEKRIKSIFIDADGILSVFLYGDLPIGKKSFNYTPAALPDWVSIPTIVDDILLRADEVFSRPENLSEKSLAEEEYDAERGG